MLNCIYDIFLTCDKNDCNDLVVQAMPMFLDDARNCTRTYVADETDISKWHEHAADLDAQSGVVRTFIGRHYDHLVEAYQFHNRSKFDTVVEECIKADIEDAKKDGDDSGEVEE